MKPWTHFVTCSEIEEIYGKNYGVKAVQVREEWRLAERKIQGGYVPGTRLLRRFEYGSILNNVRVLSSR